MSDAVGLLAAAVAGLGLGFVYFGGLWLTLRMLPGSRRPALLALGSFAARMALLLAGIYVVMGERWERAVVCVGGAMVARILLVRKLRPDTKAPELTAR
ncbi:MAG: ATP synthase subunit I [Candidatus Brocadiia bacterium]